MKGEGRAMEGCLMWNNAADEAGHGQAGSLKGLCGAGWGGKRNLDGPASVSSPEQTQMVSCCR